MSPKPTLGKGLGALFPDLAKNLDKRLDYLTVGIEELRPNRFQPRRDFKAEQQEGLVASVKKNGIIQPLVVRRLTEGGYEIIAGERRWRAAQEAGIKEVPVVIREAEDRDLAEISLIENLQREDLNPIEEGEAYATLMGRFGLTQEEIAARVGKDRSTVANTLRLLKLPPEVKKALVEKKISTGHARALLALPEPSDQLRALRVVQNRSLTVRGTERLVRLMSEAKREKGGERKREPYFQDLEKRLTERFLAPVRLRGRDGSGRIEILFSSVEELDRLLGLLLKL
ncbi:MAG TPA: ParB/RepB/Spo0J family partition protein [Syntrophales bacterium]|nr:ParB/RepB/Spo0J family partition protein [Syntrophales bacterium]HRV42449.1 ParB/RepB/Spo0J family partition protein [Syntrophales bacterium]